MTMPCQIVQCSPFKKETLKKQVSEVEEETGEGFWGCGNSYGLIMANRNVFISSHVNQRLQLIESLVNGPLVTNKLFILIQRGGQFISILQYINYNKANAFFIIIIINKIPRLY